MEGRNIQGFGMRLLWLYEVIGTAAKAFSFSGSKDISRREKTAPAKKLNKIRKKVKINFVGIKRICNFDSEIKTKWIC